MYSIYPNNVEYVNEGVLEAVVKTGSVCPSNYFNLVEKVAKRVVNWDGSILTMGDSSNINIPNNTTNITGGNFPGGILDPSAFRFQPYDQSYKPDKNVGIGGTPSDMFSDDQATIKAREAAKAEGQKTQPTTTKGKRKILPLSNETLKGLGNGTDGKLIGRRVQRTAPKSQTAKYFNSITGAMGKWMGKHPLGAAAAGLTLGGYLFRDNDDK